MKKKTLNYHSMIFLFAKEIDCENYFLVSYTSHLIGCKHGAVGLGIFVLIPSVFVCFVFASSNL